MRFKRLVIKKWQQFNHVDMVFHEKLTILTGANGSGKTTLLEKILASHCGWRRIVNVTPIIDKSTGKFHYPHRIYKGKTIDSNKIGEITYDNLDSTDIIVPNNNQTEYYITFPQMKNVECLLIPYKRLTYKYQKLSNIPLDGGSKKIKSHQMFEVSKSTYEHKTSDSASLVMKETLIGWAMNKDDDDYFDKDQESKDLYDGFISILYKILPAHMKFEKLKIRKNELIFICNDGKDEFLLEQVSGGISSLIEISWNIYLFSENENHCFTVVIDEVENHLHPKLQREILPALLNAFPNVSFIVSTHSPLVIGSVRESNVYALKYNQNRIIDSHKLDLVNHAKTATEILDEVLDVPFSMPIWVEDELKKIIDSYSKKKMTSGELSNMRSDLKKIGLERLMSDAVCHIYGNKYD